MSPPQQYTMLKSTCLDAGGCSFSVSMAVGAGWCLSLFYTTRECSSE